MISGDYSTVGQLIADNGAIKTQLDTLTEQVSSGLVSNSYGGLGAAAQEALDLNPQINNLTAQQNTISQASGQLDVTQTALSEIASIASNFAAETVNLNGIDPDEVDSVAASATQALGELASLLDTTDGSTYVFAGTDASNPPIPDPSDITSSSWYTQINAAVGALATNGASATVASTLAIAESNAPGTTPFSAALSTAPTAPTINLGNGQEVQVGVLANTNTLATSTGTSTTGSYMRDLLRGLATLSSLSSSQVNTAGFTALVSDTQTSLQGAVTALATETGTLGNIQSNLTAQGTQLSDTSTALTTQLSSVQDVDMATTLTLLSATQTQLQASYQMLAAQKNLSLVQYL
jgi:flagellar hook-associated protein 3 FlgL